MRRLLGIVTNRRATAAVEFAMLAPVLIVIAMSLADVTDVVIVRWQLAATADAVARIATTYAATDTNSNGITLAQGATASTAVFAVIPALSSAALSTYGVTISSVVMTATSSTCTTNCTYVANTAWSAPLQGTAATRPCGRLRSVPDTQSPSFSVLPADTFTAAPLLVVYVRYTFAPLLSTLFGTTMHFMESAYMAARTGGNADWVRLTGPNIAQLQCAGYTG